MDLTIQTAFILAVLIAALILAGYLEWSYARGRLMRKRSARLAAGVAREEAFNASVTTKAIMRNLRAQGYDVARAEPLVRQTDAELEMGNFTNAKLLAEDAKNTLFEIKSASVRQTGGLTKEAAGETAGAQKGQGIRQAPPPAEAQQPVAQKKLPRNYAEASFTIKSVETEVEKAAGEGKNTGIPAKFLAEAKENFEDERYDDALRLAVRASRSLAGEGGGETNIQAIPPQTPAKSGETPKTANHVCEECGAPLKAGDSFCRKCGGKIRLQCPACGEQLSKGDTFCGKCGGRIES